MRSRTAIVGAAGLGLVLACVLVPAFNPGAWRPAVHYQLLWRLADPGVPSGATPAQITGMAASARMEGWIAWNSWLTQLGLALAVLGTVVIATAPRPHRLRTALLTVVAWAGLAGLGITAVVPPIRIEIWIDRPTETEPEHIGPLAWVYRGDHRRFYPQPVRRRLPHRHVPRIAWPYLAAEQGVIVLFCAGCAAFILRRRRRPDPA